jgi:hypothetical protein
VQTTGLSLQGSKGWLFVKTNPAQPCFDLMHAKEEHFSTEMIEYLVQHYTTALPALPASQHPLISDLVANIITDACFLAQNTSKQGPSFVVMPTIGPAGTMVRLGEMLRWAREDNRCYSGDADCQAAYYGDTEATAMEHLYAPGKILGFVTPTLVGWNSEAATPAITGGMMAVVSTCDSSHSRESVFSTKYHPCVRAFPLFHDLC